MFFHILKKNVFSYKLPFYILCQLLNDLVLILILRKLAHSMMSIIQNYYLNLSIDFLRFINRVGNFVLFLILEEMLTAFHH